MDDSKLRQINRLDLNAKWEACVDLTVRRLTSSSLVGAFAGLLLFRSPATRWSSVAFGAGVGLGSAYIESSYIFSGPPKLAPVEVSSRSSARGGQP
ncbi:hypothetical protein HPP92_016944 [Vanilla planifolia]|uniref:MICOS complex subunit MIC10 n=1 Tax=Vanilla planifolia TaxID=51239 RepID=A0A835UNX9_VANPL|nr:hypothetical protein HPP92_016944 [Vanilla planifolia]